MAPGTLYIVGTPIGNLEDMTLRALRVLREVSVIAAEDTRQTRKLLQHFTIPTPLISYHEHNERARSDELLDRLQAGEDVALVTDAGMPAVSDPGEYLVGRARALGLPVAVVPGPTAAVAALVVSGLPAAEFVFMGFLPRKGKERRLALATVAREPRTCILYEAPHRVLATLADLAQAAPGRRAAACRELTKKFEEVRQGTAAELLEHFRSHPPRGEFTLVLEGAPATGPAAAGPGAGQPSAAAGPDTMPPPDPTHPAALATAVAHLEATGLDRKSAIKEVARRSGLPKGEVYRAVHRPSE